MNKKYCLSILLGILSPLIFWGQASFPSYPDILNKFFSQYSFEPAEYTDGIIFAKRKTGWYVDVVNRLKNDSIIKEQLFWSATDNKYRHIQQMDEPGDEKQINDKISEYLGPNVSFNYYGYERCRYFGYNSWAGEMIRDFGSYTGQSDTLIEGLARAYSFYSSNYLWYQFGGANPGNDTLMYPLGLMEFPSIERTMMTKYYIEQGIKWFKKLQTINPDYKILVGNSGMKVFNEIMHGYMQMKMCRNDQYAKEFLDQISLNETIAAIAKNYLSGCAPNAILFTYGDNDTYPLWYVQETQQYRKDVTIINISLLGHVPWVNNLKKSNSVLFSLNDKQFSEKTMEYSPFKARDEWPGTKPIALPAFIKMIIEKKFGTTDSDETTKATYPSKNVVLATDPLKFKKQSTQPGLGTKIECELGEYILLSDLLILDIINSNIYTRPVYFTAKNELFPGCLQQEGLIYRLLPLNKTEKQPSVNSIKKTEAFFTNNFTPVFSFSSGSTITISSDFDNRILDIYIMLSYYYFTKGLIVSAKKWALKAADFFESPEIPVSMEATKLASILIKTGYKDKAITLLENMAKRVFQLYNTPSAINLFIFKESAIYFIKEIKYFLTENNISGKQVDIIYEVLAM
jgi:hypothetical protein